MAALEDPRATGILLSAFKNLAVNDRSSDFLIVCGTREWNVHKTVLALHSAVFDKFCYSPFKEADQARVDLVEDDPAVLDDMLKFFYTFDYDLNNSLTESVKLSVMADKYDAKLLGHFLAKSRNVRMRTRAMLQEFVDVTEYVYKNPGGCDNIKDEILDIAVSTRMGSPAFRDLMKATPELTADLAERAFVQASKQSCTEYWRQHHFLCASTACRASFYADIPDTPHEEYVCFECEWKMTGQEWQSHRLAPSKVARSG